MLFWILAIFRAANGGKIWPFLDPLLTTNNFYFHNSFRNNLLIWRFECLTILDPYWQQPNFHFFSKSFFLKIWKSTFWRFVKNWALESFSSFCLLIIESLINYHLYLILKTQKYDFYLFHLNFSFFSKKVFDQHS